MIVKNEANNLAACLATVQDFVSEIIIVDTGSTDRTVELAHSLGAKVKHFTWIDDFAAARNESIKDAGGDWIFWMDADDRISPQNLTRLKQALVLNQADAYLCSVVSPREQSQSVVEHLRLFRNHLGLHFERPLHETVLPVADRLGLTLARTNVVIDHSGYAIEAQDLQAKARRNLGIIRQCLAREPDNLHWRYHLGATLAVLEQYDEAIKEFELMVVSPPATLNWDFDVYQAHVSLVGAYVELQRFDQARSALKRALSVFPNRRHLTIMAGVFYLLQDEPETAIQMLERARTLSLDSDRVGQTWPTGKLEAELGFAYSLVGNLPQARQMYQKRLAQIGTSSIVVPPDMWQEALSLFSKKAYEKVVEILEPVAQNDPAALRLLARAEQQRQRWHSAARYFSQALALGEPLPGELTSLAEAVFRSGRPLSARRLCQLDRSGDNYNADTLNLLGLVAMQQNELEPALAHLVQAILADPEHISAHHNLQQIAAALQLSLPETIRQYGLRMLRQQAHPSAAEAFALLIDMCPSDAEAYKDLAVALQGLGQEEEALLAWQTAQRVVV
ncbi:MAG: glycosyltransferase [Chloroflexota bacterium]